MKWVVDNLGFEEVQRRVLKTRHFLLGSSTWPGGIPAEVIEMGDAPAGTAGAAGNTAMGQGTPVVLRRAGAFERWEDSNVIRGAAKGTVSAIAHCRLGDVTTAQFHGLAAIVREFGVDVRVVGDERLQRDTAHRSTAVSFTFSQYSLTCRTVSENSSKFTGFTI